MQALKSVLYSQGRWLTSPQMGPTSESGSCPGLRKLKPSSFSWTITSSWLFRAAKIRTSQLRIFHVCWPMPPVQSPLRLSNASILPCLLLSIVSVTYIRTTSHSNFARLSSSSFLSSATDGSTLLTWSWNPIKWGTYVLIGPQLLTLLSTPMISRGLHSQFSSGWSIPLTDIPTSWWNGNFWACYLSPGWLSALEELHQQPGVDGSNQELANTDAIFISFSHLSHICCFVCCFLFSFCLISFQFKQLK